MKKLSVHEIETVAGGLKAVPYKPGRNTSGLKASSAYSIKFNSKRDSITPIRLTRGV